MKVFGAGLQRTGLSSLTRALTGVGVRTKQFPKELYDDVRHELMQQFDGFTDFPIPLLYQKLDEAYPGSKFIHTVRDEAAWLRSVHWLFTTGALKFNWANHHYADLFHGEFYGVTTFDETIFMEKYRAYNQEVRDYFAERPADLLLIDITAGDGYEQICPFLGLPPPSQPFPHTNQRESRYQVVARRLRRRVRRLRKRR